MDDEENRQRETEHNKARTMPKAKCVFLIFCKSFGSSKIGYTTCMFTVVVRQSYVGWGISIVYTNTA